MPHHPLRNAVSAPPRILVLLTGLALTGLVHAHHPLITDDAGTQGTGGNQFEFGYDYARSKADGVTARERGIPLTYTRGILDNLDVFIGTTRATHPKNGWSNLGVGAKWRIFEDEANERSMALKPEIALPVSRKAEEDGLRTAKTSYGLTFIYSQETPFGELHFNAAAERANTALESADRKQRYRVSVAPVWQVTDSFKLALDVGVQTNPDSGQKARMGYVQLGAVYSPDKNLDLSFGLTRDLMDGPVNTTAATLGLTWLFR